MTKIRTLVLFINRSTYTTARLPSSNLVLIFKRPVSPSRVVVVVVSRTNNHPTRAPVRNRLFIRVLPVNRRWSKHFTWTWSRCTTCGNPLRSRGSNSSSTCLKSWTYRWTNPIWPPWRSETFCWTRTSACRTWPWAWNKWLGIRTEKGSRSPRTSRRPRSNWEL